MLLVSTGNQWKWRRSLMRLLYKNKRELIQSGWAEIGYDWCVPSQGRGHWFKAWTLTYSNDLKCIFNITGAHRVYSNPSVESSPLYHWSDPLRRSSCVWIPCHDKQTTTERFQRDGQSRSVRVVHETITDGWFGDISPAGIWWIFYFWAHG